MVRFIIKGLANDKDHDIALHGFLWCFLPNFGDYRTILMLDRFKRTNQVSINVSSLQISFESSFEFWLSLDRTLNTFYQ